MNKPEELARIAEWARAEFSDVWESNDRDEAFYLCNEIRRGLGLSEFSKLELEKAWQYRLVFSPSYLVALEEFINFTFGCW